MSRPVCPVLLGLVIVALLAPDAPAQELIPPKHTPSKADIHRSFDAQRRLKKLGYQSDEMTFDRYGRMIDSTAYSPRLDEYVWGPGLRLEGVPDSAGESHGGHITLKPRACQSDMLDTLPSCEAFDVMIVSTTYRPATSKFQIVLVPYTVAGPQGGPIYKLDPSPEVLHDAQQAARASHGAVALP